MYGEPSEEEIRNVPLWPLVAYLTRFSRHMISRSFPSRIGRVRRQRKEILESHLRNLELFTAISDAWLDYALDPATDGDTYIEDGRQIRKIVTGQDGRTGLFFRHVLCAVGEARLGNREEAYREAAQALKLGSTTFRAVAHQEFAQLQETAAREGWTDDTRVVFDTKQGIFVTAEQARTERAGPYSDL